MVHMCTHTVHLFLNIHMLCEASCMYTTCMCVIVHEVPVHVEIYIIILQTILLHPTCIQK